MYKYIALTMLYLLTAKQTYALEQSRWTEQNCTNRGGNIVEDNYGHVFCRSTKRMNFYSAHVWCQKHGGNIPSLQTVCPGTPQVSSGLAYCNNIRWHAWLSNTQISSSGKIKALVAHGGDGNIYWKNPMESDFQALCE